MASGKMSPRQKMINMMYLVLIALLALNVTSEILNAFRVIGNSVRNSNIGLQEKNAQMLATLKSRAGDAPNAKAIIGYADEVDQESKALIAFIEEKKMKVLNVAQGKIWSEEFEDSVIVKQDDIDGSTHILVEQKEGEEIKKKIEETRVKFLNIVEKANADPNRGKQARESFEKNMSLKVVEPPKGKDWADANFHHVPAVGVEVMMLKFQNDVLNTQANIIEYLASQIGANLIKFDRLGAKVIAPKSYLLAGKEYTADIFLSASSTSTEFEVFMGSIDKSKLPSDTSKYETSSPDDLALLGGGTKVEKNGSVATYKTSASGVGERDIAGVIRIKNPGTGKFELYPWQTTYEVAPPSGFTVTADKMNVFYIGVDNPVTITVGGAADNAVSASITGGTITSKGGGKYTVRVTTPGTAKVNVSAKIDGEQKSFPPYEYRVKRIPDPVATLGGKLKGGKVQKATLAGQMGIVPLLENFDFDTKFDVVKYEMMYSKSGDIFRKQGAGPMITSDMKTLINGARAKDLILFNDIVVRGPDGQPRNIGSMVFEII